ncbi:MAG: hypothetical protein IJZ25_01580 [Lachnospiraceae bacterium]|nr:hypothetical protein [Lachnospiraceae bacterium]
MGKKIAAVIIVMVVCAVGVVLWSLAGKEKNQSGEKVPSALGTTKQEWKEEEIAPDKLIIFGTYEQDGNEDNGKEPLEWIILDKHDDKMLVITRYIIDSHRYNIREDTTWETSEMREWLNGEVLEETFTEEERERILSSELENPDNPDSLVEGGNATIDYIFLLSTEEVIEYFEKPSDAKAYKTAYVVDKMVFINDENQEKLDNGEKLAAGWTLRTPGLDSMHVSGAYSYGSLLNTSGNEVSNNSNNIRPAMWITIE